MTWQNDHEKQVASFPTDVREAHKRSAQHRDEIMASSVCGCFYCLGTYPPGEIAEWVDDGATWHLATDEAGYGSLLDLIGLLCASDEVGSNRVVQLAPVTPAVLAVPNNQRSAFVAPERARLVVDGDCGKWRFDEADTVLTITVGTRQLNGLSAWLAQRNTAFDSTYGASPPLWFWGIVATVK